MKVLFFGMLLVIIPAISIYGQVMAVGNSGVTASVYSSGSWTVQMPTPGWTFAGALGSVPQSLRNSTGRDNLGAFEEVAWEYSIANGPRSASIRVYPDRPVVLFLTTCATACNNTSPFPTFSSYPAIFHMSYNNDFAEHDFTHLPSSSPWVFFDASANSFILSAASNFMTSSVSKNASNVISSGISNMIPKLPAGFSHSTILAFGAGINKTFEAWGNTLTTLSGKQRPGNDADPLLRSISYWTDNGATYYYNPGDLSYMDTLGAVKAEFESKGIRLGSMQLDSWWYPKGPDNNWSSHSGIWTYTASPSLFPPGLPSFQKNLGTSLVTHSRWIDINSPYRSQYTISGNVAIDPKYWDDIAGFLKESGVTTYEQDWLAQDAHTDFNLSDPSAFLGNMSSSMAKQGLTIQYCMALPNHFMESSKYSNVTSIRTSQDRFGQGRYTHFFYSSRLASALGAWPFSDVLMSGETHNLIAATLSAGPLGVGDPMGSISAGGLLKAVRADGVIIKPDTAAVPLDSVYVNDAQKKDAPMVASATTDYGDGLRENYIVAYPRGAGTSLTLDPAEFGMPGPTYLYNFLESKGTVLGERAAFTTEITSGFEYYVLAPIGRSGIAFLGDKGHYVTLGRKRISLLTDNGAIESTVLFAEGEQNRTLFGYSPRPVTVSSVVGSHGTPTWNPSTQIFTVKVRPSPKTGTARVRIAQAGTPEACEGRCANTMAAEPARSR